MVRDGDERGKRDESDEGDALFDFAADEDGQWEEDRDTAAGEAPWRVLVIDDEPEVHAITRLALADLVIDGRPIALTSAESGAEARAILEATPELALVLLDVVMESEHAGLGLARWIREELGNRLVRIVLRTGQPGMAPERQVMLDYDINDYRPKTELTAQRLTTTVLGAIRSYRDLCVIDCQKQGLQRVVDASATLFDRSSFEEFLGGLLLQIGALLRPRRSTMFVQALGPLFGLRDDVPRLIAGTGRFANAVGKPAPELLSSAAWDDVRAAIADPQALHRPGYSVFGLCYRQRSWAAVFVETTTPLSSWESHLLEVFCHNATVALDNLRLHHRQLALLAAFERFVPRRLLGLAGIDDVTEAIVGAHIQREVAVVFADLRSFTRLAETLSPSDTFTFLNDFFAAIVPAIHTSGGVVDKYLGDGLMALFPGGPTDAVRAALGMVAATRAFAAQHLAQSPASPVAPRIGVGVHAGPIILGLVGAADRLDFTGISDGVNVAARIERLTRPFDADLLVSAAISDRLPPELQAQSRPLGRMVIRGKDQTVDLLEVFAGDPPALHAAKSATRGPLLGIAAAIAASQWQEARDLLGPLQRRFPADAALLTLDRYCRHQLLLGHGQR